MTSQVGEIFERLARTFLSAHPEVRHEWKEFSSRWQGTGQQLVCDPSGAREVWAHYSPTSVAVGTAGEHEDFEDFGQFSDEQVAQQAFARLHELLEANGHVPKRSNDR
jgi:hypothetical protein